MPTPTEAFLKACMVEQHLTKTLHIAMPLYLTPQSLQRASDDHLTLVLRLVEGSEEKRKM